MSESTSLSVVSDGAETEPRARAIEYEFLSVFSCRLATGNYGANTSHWSPFYVFRRQQSSAFSVHAFPAHSTSSPRNSEIFESQVSERQYCHCIRLTYCPTSGDKPRYMWSNSVSYCRWEISDKSKWRTRGDAWAEFGSRSSDAPLHSLCRPSKRSTFRPSFNQLANPW